MTCFQLRKIIALSITFVMISTLFASCGFVKDKIGITDENPSEITEVAEVTENDAEDTEEISAESPTQTEAGEKDSIANPTENPTNTPASDPTNTELPSLTNLIKPTDLLTVYTDPSSAEYKRTGNMTVRIETGLDSEYSTAIRFTAAFDGVSVRLESGTWNPYHSYYEIFDEIFTIETKKGEVYSFEGYMSETIPMLQIVAEYRGLIVIWGLQDDMKDGNTVFTLTGKKWAPSPLYEESGMVSLCAAYTVAYYNAFLSASDDNYFMRDKLDTVNAWDTVELAVTLNFSAAGYGDDEYVYVRGDVLKAYMKAMFPEAKELQKIPNGYFEVESATTNLYILRPYESTVMKSFVYVCPVDDDESSWMTAIGITEPDGYPLTFVVYLDANEEYEPNNPFEYHITGIAILGGDTP